jgi:hypothetical protein
MATLSPCAGSETEKFPLVIVTGVAVSWLAFDVVHERDVWPPTLTAAAFAEENDGGGYTVTPQFPASLFASPAFLT